MEGVGTGITPTSGINDAAGEQKTRTYNFQPLAYRFNNGVPNQITMTAGPRPKTSSNNFPTG